MEISSGKQKRPRDDSEADSSVSKIPRVDSDSDVNSSESHVTRVNSGEECVNSDGYELVRVDSEDPTLDSRDIQHDLLNILNDTDNMGERDTMMQGLDSVIKSFEEEILAPGQDAVVLDPLPESGELQMDLGYLLEASDDELGLPPSAKPQSEEAEKVGTEEVDLGGLLGFEDEIGLGGTEENEGGCFESLDGLLEYEEPYDVLWRSESLQAM